LPDPKNMEVAVGISLLSCLRAEILSTSGQWPPSFIYDILIHRTASLLLTACFVALKRVIAVEIVLLSCIFAEIRVITLFQPPSWISDFRFYLGGLLIALLKSFTPKT